MGGKLKRNEGRRASHVGKHSFKVLLVGSVNVGKTSLLRRFTDDVFDEDTLVTVGFDFRSKLISVPMNNPQHHPHQHQHQHHPCSSVSNSASNSTSAPAQTHVPAPSTAHIIESNDIDDTTQKTPRKGKRTSHTQGLRGAYESIAALSSRTTTSSSPTSSNTHTRTRQQAFFPDHVYGFAKVGSETNESDDVCVETGSADGSSSVSASTASSNSNNRQQGSRNKQAISTKQQREQEERVAVRLEIWDTAGQERFKTVTNTYYRKARAVLLCFDVSSRASFADVSLWLRDVRTSAPPSTQCALVAMKTDLSSDAWNVPSSEARAWAQARDMLFFEVSAKTGKNVDNAFSTVAQHLVEAMASSQNLRLNMPIPNPIAISTQLAAEGDGVYESGVAFSLGNMARNNALRAGWCGVPPPIRRPKSAEISRVPLSNEVDDGVTVIRRCKSGEVCTCVSQSCDTSGVNGSNRETSTTLNETPNLASSATADCGHKEQLRSIESADGRVSTNPASPQHTHVAPPPRVSKNKSDDSAPADWPILGLAQMLAISAKEHHQLYTIRRASSTGSAVSGGGGGGGIKHSMSESSPFADGHKWGSNSNSTSGTMACRHGCGASFPARDYEAHVRSCAVRPVFCRLGCGETLRLSQMESHEQAYKLLPLARWGCTDVLHWMVDVIGTEAWDLNAIRENEIDGRCLIQLTNEDLLESLRINSGIRRTRVLRAIEHLSTETDAMRSTGAVFHEYQDFRPNVAPTALQTNNIGAVTGVGAVMRVASAASAFANNNGLPRRIMSGRISPTNNNNSSGDELQRPSSAPKSFTEIQQHHKNQNNNKQNHNRLRYHHQQQQQQRQELTEEEEVPDMWNHLAREAAGDGLRSHSSMSGLRSSTSASAPRKIESKFNEYPFLSTKQVEADTTGNDNDNDKVGSWESQLRQVGADNNIDIGVSILSDNANLAAERQRQWEAFDDSGGTKHNKKHINMVGTDKINKNNTAAQTNDETTNTVDAVSGTGGNPSTVVAAPASPPQLGMIGTTSGILSSFPSSWPPTSQQQQHQPVQYPLAQSIMPPPQHQHPYVGGGGGRTAGKSANVQLQGGQNVLVRCIRFSELCVDPSSVIGSGSYGTVYKAVYHGARCVFKQLHNQQLDEGELLREAAVMQSVSAHPHITHFFGVTTEGPRGFVHEALHASLEEWLLRSKGNHEEPLSEILRFASEAASGLLHLHCEAVVHRDVAARNLLLDSSRPRKVKICDFGMARLVAVSCSSASGCVHNDSNNLDSDNNPDNHTDVMMRGSSLNLIGPVRWMAPESLSPVDGHTQFSLKSDVFMFGISLWELLARDVPYSTIPTSLVGGRVLDSDLRPPQACSPVVKRSINRILEIHRHELSRTNEPPVAHSLVALMERCWASDPNQRPSMQAVHEELSRLARRV